MIDSENPSKHQDEAQANELNALWQSQQTHGVDRAKVEKLARSQQQKQRLYIAMDVASLSPFLLFFVFEIEFSRSFMIFTAFLFLSGVLMVGYLIKLRWQAAFDKFESTNSYMALLIKQYKSNARVAQVNKHIGWLTATIGIPAIWLFNFIDAPNLSERIDNLVWVTLGMLVALIAWCTWAHKRQKRFEQDVEALSKQL